MQIVGAAPRFRRDRHCCSPCHIFSVLSVTRDAGSARPAEPTPLSTGRSGGGTRQTLGGAEGADQGGRGRLGAGSPSSVSSCLQESNLTPQARGNTGLPLSGLFLSALCIIRQSRIPSVGLESTGLLGLICKSCAR